MFLQHDNARPHTSKITKEEIKALGWTTIRHPPYSLDLAPSDYHLFWSMQHSLNGKEFKNYEEVTKGICECFASKPTEFYERGIKKLTEMWNAVIIYQTMAIIF